ncbi:hypothetical protein FAM09_15685 [Niastella caeni]|uniref:Uncharacterized protein n=1 Tax=Niastella caeni TaxID=2569763 RepID=A0A4S8HVP8_9BACT|nr:membrane lipoprotein lipid attachment site-containing protein [Niastella caeni]THU38124.1 hypothetical protein FAM09_15685 [Niastella caeni]
MKKMIVVAGFALLLAGCCKKDNVPEATNPEMRYLNLNDSGVVFNRSASFDLDGNGSKDIYFTTMLVADPLNKQDKKQWWVTSSFYANLPVNDIEEIPVMQMGETIYPESFSGYTWYNASGVILAQKIFTDNQPPYWAGKWKDASRRFIAIQIINNSKVYNGWVEISFSNTEEKVIIHRAAICKEANNTIKAGW